MFVSGLSVNEFVLLPRLTNLAVVAGSIVYPARGNEVPGTSKKLTGQTNLQTRILRTAYTRMQSQAEKLGASGVIDVHSIQREVAPDLWEHTVQGTAVNLPEARPGSGFACTFTGQDYYALTATGYSPVGVVLGVSVYYQKFHQRVQRRVSGGSGRSILTHSTERSDFTRGLYTARRNAMTALETEAAALGADGVLGISVTAKRTPTPKPREGQGMMIEFIVLGTAVTANGSDTFAVNYGLPLVG